jgi:IS5 family transposase
MQFYEKLNRYVDAGWWKEFPMSQASLLICLPKKDRRLQTVIDARQRNDNTIKDVTPLPDQDAIREDVARAKYRSKINLADTYKQVRVEPNDMQKTVFSTIMGTYISNVVQQGDCNAPATFQRLMTAIFRDVIGRSHHAFIDDIFIYSDSLEDHERHLRIVFS